MRRRSRKTLGSSPGEHHSRAGEWIDAARISGEMAHEYGGKGKCVAAITALVRAAKNYGAAVAHMESVKTSPRSTWRKLRKAKRTIERATEAAMRCDTRAEE